MYIVHTYIHHAYFRFVQYILHAHFHVYASMIRWSTLYVHSKDKTKTPVHTSRCTHVPLSQPTCGKIAFILYRRQRGLRRAVRSPTSVGSVGQFQGYRSRIGGVQPCLSASRPACPGTAVTLYSRVYVKCIDSRADIYYGCTMYIQYCTYSLWSSAWLA